MPIPVGLQWHVCQHCIVLPSIGLPNHLHACIKYPEFPVNIAILTLKAASKAQVVLVVVFIFSSFRPFLRSLPLTSQFNNRRGYWAFI